MVLSASNGGLFPATETEKDEWVGWNDKLGVPYFVPNQTHIVYAPLGHTTYLHCIVGNLGDRQVFDYVSKIGIGKQKRCIRRTPEY